MAFKQSFLPSLLHSHPTPFAFRPLRSFHTPASFARARASQQPRVIAIARPAPTPTRISPLSLGIAGALALTGLSLSSPSRRVGCESATSVGQLNAPRVVGESRRPLSSEQPQSIVNAYELSFGAVCGICAGIFVKKGAKAIAFLLGGAFVFLQYLSTKSYITVDWAKVGSRYDSAFGTKTPAGGYSGPTLGRVWSRLVDFLTANFQQRASFLAGLALGLRLG
ncbi:hypothetical protein IAT38_000574 [Cryptococcus sp. DSM 104549]